MSIAVTGWLAVEGEYGLWAWGVALAVGMLAPLLPDFAVIGEDEIDVPNSESLPTDRVLAAYTRAARL